MNRRLGLKDVYSDLVISSCMEWFGTFDLQWALETIDKLNAGHIPQSRRLITLYPTKQKEVPSEGSSVGVVA